MWSFSNTWKYIVLAILLFLLTKAFCGEQVENVKIIILIVLVMSVIIFMDNAGGATRREGFDPTDPAYVKSVYPSPSMRPKLRDDTLWAPAPDLSETEEYNPELMKDQDLVDLKDIMGIDKITEKGLIQKETEAEQKIKDRHRNEMQYTNSHPYNTIPLGSQIYSYTYLPPENWFRAYERPPVCITDRAHKNEVYPVGENKYTDLMEFDTTAHITGPQGVNIGYIENKLNQLKKLRKMKLAKNQTQ